MTVEEIPCRVRRTRPEDTDFLWDVLYEAVYWPPDATDPKPSPEKIFAADPVLTRYLEGWGRPGDAGVVALSPDNERMGAAWYRLMPPDSPGYGFVNAATPDVVIAVLPEHRSRGVGSMLLRALMEVARSQGFDALSLSVQQDNRSAIRLYERCGFVKLFASENAWTMRVDLT